MSYKRVGRHSVRHVTNATITRGATEEGLKAMLLRGIEKQDFSTLRLFATPAQIKMLVRDHARSLPTPPRHTYIERHSSRR
jgi:hypothetical protein